MRLKQLSPSFAVSPQIAPSDVAAIAAAGFKSIICNRPDGEGADQPPFADVESAASAAGIRTRYLPVVSGKASDAEVAEFKAALDALPKSIIAYCRSGARSETLFALAQSGQQPLGENGEKARSGGFELSAEKRRMAVGDAASCDKPFASHDIVIVGGGAAGAGVAASLLKRQRDLDLAIIDPADTHYYQPGWTMVGGGIFSPADTAKDMGAVLPRKATWIKAAVAAFEPEKNTVIIEGGRAIRYNHLIVCPGIKLNWTAVQGLSETLGKHGVTSNYRYDLAPYTWELVRTLKSGRALFTQPPMPIKCAGAPQKAMYLAADHWLRSGLLADIKIGFYSAGAVLFGVPDYVPALMTYIERYRVELNFTHDLVAIDGPGKTAYFKKTDAEGHSEMVEARFDMIHVAPPQIAPDCVRSSPLACAGGWVDVDPATLRHKRYANVFGLGDATNSPNAKTAAAARKQAPVVAENLLHDKGLRPSLCAYDGYGSCPLTVERGKIVLAEFSYGGKVAASFHPLLIDGAKPSRAAWVLKERILPAIYWKAMLKGREWMATPKVMA